MGKRPNKKIRFASTAKGTKIWYVRTARSTARRPMKIRNPKSVRSNKAS